MNRPLVPTLQTCCFGRAETVESHDKDTLALYDSIMCVPRNFDPDYCAYDRYYTVGLTLVTAALSALVQSELFAEAAYQLIAVLDEALGRMCHAPKDTLWGMYYGQGKRYNSMNDDERKLAKEDFGALCHSLDVTLNEPFWHFSNLGRPHYPRFPNKSRQRKWLFVLFLLTWVPPAAMVQDVLYDLIKLPPPSPFLDAMNRLLASDYEPDGDVNDSSYTVWMIVTLPIVWWWYKSIARFMNEHAMMIASFFRVNLKRRHNNEPLLLNPKAFVQMCKNDIADGPSPPPPPPTAEELAAAKAHAEAEKQRQPDLVDATSKTSTD